MKIQNLNDLFLHTLEDIYYAEKRILKSLPTMIEKADSKALAKAFDGHLAETKEHVVRLEGVFKLLDVKPKTTKCAAIDGILKEADELIGHIEDADTRDAAMIAAAQAVEHYEITRYGTLISWAGVLGMPPAAKLLGETLKEEYGADDKLTKLAEKTLNREAAE